MDDAAHADDSTPPRRGRSARRIVAVVALASLIAGTAGALALLDGDRPPDVPRGTPPVEEVPSTAAPVADPDRVPAAAPAPRLLGVYAQNNQAVHNFERWLGRDVDLVKTNLVKTRGWEGWENPPWLEEFRGRRLAVNFMPYPNEVGGTLRKVADGRFDEHYRRAAGNLVAAGFGDADLVVGHEFNGNWFPWTAVDGRHRQFAAAYRRIVSVVRAVPDAEFRFNWVSALGHEHMRVPLELAYPGDEYVDVIGVDVYDNDWELKPGSAEDWQRRRWAKFLSMPYGLEWVAGFAAARGKPLSMPEWGATTIASNENGGGDNPYFVERMHEWIGDNDVAYHVYFQTDARDGHHVLSPRQMPKAAAAFRKRFGAPPGA